MAEQLILTATLKEDVYAELYPQIEAVVHGEADAIAKMANVAAMLWEAFAPNNFSNTEKPADTGNRPWMWVGFYRVIGDELVLGPFQGPLACTRIRHGRGVCGTAWASDSTLIVPDVNLFPGHIACSSASRSEIVVPLHDSKGRVSAVLDIDSRLASTFDNTDKLWLERIAALLSE